MPELILASASPRRREILETLGLRFQVIPSEADEAIRDGEKPIALARRLAETKALEVATRARVSEAFVLGADTIVVVDREVLNKPADDADALRMLRLLSGRAHEVITGVALVHGVPGRRERRQWDGKQRNSLLESISVATQVWFREIDDQLASGYVTTGEGRDKAGAYAIQGIGAGLTRRIEGSYGNVVGLPALETLELLQRHGAIDRWP